MKERSFTGIGAASLITVFAILCLSVFAALALSGARADQLLAQHAADTVSSYYVADTLAQRDYAELVDALAADDVSNAGGDAFYAKAEEAIGKVSGKLYADEKSYDADAHQLHASYQISEGTRLVVTYDIIADSADGALYIGEWRAEPEDMAIDESITVFDIQSILQLGN